jgi:hypothetical protein
VRKTIKRVFHARARYARTVCAALLAGVAAATLSGCLSVSADELYRLPQISEEYIKLQAHINSVLNLGAEFMPPTSGPNRHAVQLRDLDGDGRSEAIAFFNMPADSTLKIYIFVVEQGDYAVAEIIEGVGTAIESVRYADMDGDGVVELIVGWQMGASLKHMVVYSIKGLRAAPLAQAEYTGITVFDLSGDGNDDVLVFRLATQESGAMAELFVLMPDGEVVREEARLSNGVESIARVVTGKLFDGVPAIFVESEGRFDAGSLVTDICIRGDDGFANISIKGSGGVSEETVRSRLDSTDINEDGVVKVPIPRLLKAQSETAYYAIDWYAFHSDGSSSLALTTYHNNSDEWYLIMPNDWRGKVSVRRDDLVTGERTVVFSHIAGENGPYEDFLKIYKLAGDFGEERAKLPGRVILMSDASAVYAFELLAPPNSFDLSFDESIIRANFRLIYADWRGSAF